MLYSKTKDLSNSGETEQLKLQYANQVSIDFLKDVQLKDKYLLDVGCGASISLPEYLHKNHASYQLIDYNQSMVDEMMLQLKLNNLPTAVSIGDITKLEFQENTFDYVHERLVIMHIENKQSAIDECVRVAKDKVFFVGIDWSTFKWRNQDRHITDFYNIMCYHMKENGSDLFLGSKIKSLISPRLQTSEIIFKRKHGNHPDIIKSGCKSLISHMKKTSGDFSTIQRLEEIFNIVDTEGALITPSIMNILTVIK